MADIEVIRGKCSQPRPVADSVCLGCGIRFLLGFDGLLVPIGEVIRESIRRKVVMIYHLEEANMIF